MPRHTECVRESFRGEIGTEVSAICDGSPAGIAEPGHQRRVAAKRVRASLAELGVKASVPAGRGDRHLVTLPRTGHPNGEDVSPALDNPVEQCGRRVRAAAVHKQIHLVGVTATAAIRRPLPARERNVRGNSKAGGSRTSEPQRSPRASRQEAEQGINDDSAKQAEPE